MLSRTTKELFYLFASPLMRINSILYKSFRSQKYGMQTPLRVHLGPGQRKYIPGWINIDANMFTAKCDVWADLRHPLPFHNSSIEAVYSHHMIEHLPDLHAHLSDVYRCLKPGAIYRVAGPNGDSAIGKFIEGDLDWFGSWPDDRTSIGGRFENFIFCRGEHLTILTYSFLEELLGKAGFINIKCCVPSKQTFNSALFGDCLEMEEETDLIMPHTLVVEAQKPH